VASRHLRPAVADDRFELDVAVSYAFVENRSEGPDVSPLVDPLRLRDIGDALLEIDEALTEGLR
jgi:hypothetical protein